MRVYISGKIGEKVISDQTREKFARAERMLEAKGFYVFNPADEGWQDMLEKGFEQEMHRRALCGEQYGREKKYSYVLQKDLECIDDFDAVYMLDDYKMSPGARVEYEFAMATGKKMFFQRYIDAYCHLEEILKKSWSTGKPLMLPYDGEGDLDCMIRFTKKHIHEVWLALEL